MNNVFFGTTGLSSTEANFLANMASEQVKGLQEAIDGISFYRKDMQLIGSHEWTSLQIGCQDVNFVYDNLKKISEINSFIAWVREAIKAKEAMLEDVEDTDVVDWCEMNGKEYPEYPDPIKNYENFTESDLLDEWDAEKRNKYFMLEAFAATYGKYIHPNGAFSKARKTLHSIIVKSTTTSGEGRDTIIYHDQPSINPEVVEETFMNLQSTYRNYEKELNFLKAEIKEEVNKRNKQRKDEYIKRLTERDNAMVDIVNRRDMLAAEYQKWQISENERIANLRIIVPKALESIFQTIKEAVK